MLHDLLQVIFSTMAFIYSRLYSQSLTHPLLGPLNSSFNFELKAIKSLLVALREINRWHFYEALMAVSFPFFC